MPTNGSSSKKENSRNTVKLKMVRSEGGRQWLVCASAFLAQFAVVGFMMTGGVLYTKLIDEFKASRGATAWVSSLTSSVLYFCAPLSTSLSERFGCRVVTIFGGLTCILAMVLSSFYTSILHLYFTHGVLWGVGLSLSYFPTFLIVAQHFNNSKRLSLATGIITFGGSLGTLTLSPGLQRMFNRFGLSTSFRLLAAVHVVIIVCGMLFFPEKENISASQQTRKKQRCFDWSICKNREFIVFLFALGFNMLGYLVPFVHLVRMAEERGASPTEGALLISYASAASGIGRLLFGRMADCKRFSKFYIWRTGLLGMSVSSTLVIIARSYEWFVVYAFTFGLFEGCYVTLTPLLVRHIVGVRKFPCGLGMAYFSMSFTRSAGPPIAGWMYDSFHSYKVPFLYTSFVIFTGCFISFLVPLLQKRNTRTEADDTSNLQSTGVDRETDV